jgi:serine/threonine protein kinase
MINRRQRAPHAAKTTAQPSRTHHQYGGGGGGGGGAASAAVPPQLQRQAVRAQPAPARAQVQAHGRGRAGQQNRHRLAHGSRQGAGQQRKQASGPSPSVRALNDYLNENRRNGKTLGAVHDEWQHQSKLSDFTVLSELGRGAYGVVSKVRYKRDGKVYVLKEVNVGSLSSREQQEAVSEVILLRKVRHHNIVKYYDSFLDNKSLYIVMEQADSGNLQDWIARRRMSSLQFEEREVWRVYWEVAQAVAYLHRHKITHRDLTSVNVLLGAHNHVLLCDLGVSRLATSENALMRTRVGTPLFLSPEVVMRRPYCNKVDVWALGCLMYTMMALKPPFVGHNLLDLAQAITKTAPKRLPQTYSAQLRYAIGQMLCKEPSRRPSVPQALEFVPRPIAAFYAQFPRALDIPKSVLQAGFQKGALPSPRASPTHSSEPQPQPELHLQPDPEWESGPHPNVGGPELEPEPEPVPESPEPRTTKQSVRAVESKLQQPEPEKGVSQRAPVPRPQTVDGRLEAARQRPTSARARLLHPKVDAHKRRVRSVDNSATAVASCGGVGSSGEVHAGAGGEAWPDRLVKPVRWSGVRPASTLARQRHGGQQLQGRAEHAGAVANGSPTWHLQRETLGQTHDDDGAGAVAVSAVRNKTCIGPIDRSAARQKAAGTEGSVVAKGAVTPDKETVQNHDDPAIRHASQALTSTSLYKAAPQHRVRPASACPAMRSASGTDAKGRSHIVPNRQVLRQRPQSAGMLRRTPMSLAGRRASTSSSRQHPTVRIAM